MSIGGVEAGAKGVQSVAETGQGGCGGDEDVCSGGGTDGGGGGYGRDGDGDILSRWEGNVANLTLGTEPDDPLAYAPGLEHHHPIMSTLGETGS